MTKTRLKPRPRDGKLRKITAWDAAELAAMEALMKEEGLNGFTKLVRSLVVQRCRELGIPHPAMREDAA